MPRISYGQIKNRQLAVTHNWNLRLEAIPPCLSASNYPGLVGVDGKLNALCETSALPNATLTVAQGKIRGITVKQGTLQEVEGDLNLVFFEEDSIALKTFFEDWKDAHASRHSGLQGTKKKTHTDAFFLDLLSGEDGEVIETYQLLGAFCTNATLGELTGEGEFQRLTVAIGYENYDRPNSKKE